MQKITISSRTKAWRLLNCSHTASYGLQQVSSLHHVFLEGEQALLIDSRRRNLIKLDSTKYTDTAVGRLSHADIIGKEVGAQHRTALGGRVTVRRPSLEEYTLLMHRGATPSYCSVVYAAVCMMDVGGGSRVVEAGSGSGAMTLHLSRIVGAGGCVSSFEVKQSHLDIARQNFTRWANSWDLVHTHSHCRWPGNVSFYCNGLEEARQYLGEHVDAVFVDLPHVNSVLSTVEDILQPCRVAVLFLPNITQAIEADAYIRLNGLALNTEEIVGVSQEQWTVKPAHTKRLIAPGDTTSTTAGSHITASERTQSTGVVVPAYICRPSHRQPPHTGFLMKLRKTL